jgi:hypothetical protein
MPIDSEALNYIKENFENKNQVDDYIELLDKVYSYGVTFPVGRNIAYPLFIGGSFDAQNFIESDNYWYSNTPPKAKGIINPYASDNAWVSLRKEALSAVITRHGGQNVGLVDDATAIEFLRARIDKKIPLNLKLNDQKLEALGVWEKFYNNDLDGTDRIPGLGNGSTLFGSWEGLGVYVHYVKQRLKNFNFDTGESGDSSQAPPPESSDELLYDDRIAALEEFLSNSKIDLSWDASSRTSGLFRMYSSKNQVPGYSPLNDVENKDNYTLFSKILAPARETNLLKLSDDFQSTLFSKLENSGLLDLLVYVDQIRQFGRDRFKSPQSVQASAGLVVNRSKRYSVATNIGTNTNKAF